MGLFKASAGLRGVKRFGVIAKVLIKHGLGDVVEKIVGRKDKEGEPAKIKAEIKCGSVIVYGRVEGNITVDDRVEIRANAEVIGDIKANALVMEAGAVFVGASTIGTPRNRTTIVGATRELKKKGAAA